MILTQYDILTGYGIGMLITFGHLFTKRDGAVERFHKLHPHQPFAELSVTMAVLVWTLVWPIYWGVKILEKIKPSP